MPTSQEIRARVVRVVAQALGADEREIVSTDRLQEDLGAESIDFLDIVFRVEREFGIRVPRGELFPESLFGDNAEFVQDGCVTDEGVALLRAAMPYAELGGLDTERLLQAVSDLFTVDLVARYVEWKLCQSNASIGPVSTAVAADSQTRVPELSAGVLG
jgi:acyl carrier protein